MTEDSEEWNNAMNIHKAMGYTFHLDQYKLSAQNGQPAVEVNLKNIGVAPMYCNWDVELGYLVDGAVVSLGSTPWNLNLIQPDVENNYRSYMSESTLEDGNYTFVIRIVNPLEEVSADAPSVTFANATMDQDAEGWLTLGEAEIVSGSLGTVPTPVAGIALSQSSIELGQDQSFALSATLMPLNATNTSVTWISDHPGTVSVDANGQVQSVGDLGTAVIKAYSQDGAYSAECLVTVIPYVPELPALIEAEKFVDVFGLSTEPTGDEGGGLNIGDIQDNEWLDYDVMVTGGGQFILDARVASESNGGAFELRDELGNTLASVSFGPTGNWQVYTTVSTGSFSLPEGQQRLRIHVTVGAFNLNWIEFKRACPADIDGSGVVDVNDLLLLFPDWDSACTSCAADVDKNGIVGLSDLIFVLAEFNSICVEE